MTTFREIIADLMVELDKRDSNDPSFWVIYAKILTLLSQLPFHLPPPFDHAGYVTRTRALYSWFALCVEEEMRKQHYEDEGHETSWEDSQAGLDIRAEREEMRSLLLDCIPDVPALKLDNASNVGVN
jgi:hypothetical protein